MDSLVLEELTEGDRELLESSLKRYYSAADDTSKINALDHICMNMMHDDWSKYQYVLKDVVEAALKKENSKKVEQRLLVSLSESYNNIGFIQMGLGEIDNALENYHISLKIKKKIGNKKGVAAAYNNIGGIYDTQGNIPKALKYYLSSLKIREQLGDPKDIAHSLNNIGYIHNAQENFQDALVYYKKSLKKYQEAGDKKGAANTIYNIGGIYFSLGDFDEAIINYDKSLVLKEEIGDKKGIAYSLNAAGLLYYKQGDINKGIDYGNRALAIRLERKDKEGISQTSYLLGLIHFESGDLTKAYKHSMTSMEMAKMTGFPSDIKKAALLLSKIYEKQGNGMKALQMHKLHDQMKDSINNENTQKASIRQQAKYEYEKAQAVTDKEHEKQLEIEKEAKAKQRVIIYAASGGLGLVGIFLFFVMNRLKITRKQKAVIEQQKEEVEEAHQEIRDSISYAKRIQSAILPPIKMVKEYLNESFILYKPKDVVAGDFYWMESVAPTSKNKSTKVLFAAADCTGHGVPGAMVSVVCNNALNRSVREHGLTEPGKILDKTREIVIKEFEKSEEEVKDGMDIAICSLEGNKLKYAGANNPLWIIRNGAIIETKANKQPIGQFDNPEPYTTHSFDLEPGDSIYIFSDGYVDQFGGEKGKKFKAKAFRELLLSVQDKAMEEQNVIIDEAFETWRGSLEQIDDVCVIGVKL